jgi:hypothetical protein
MLAVSEAGLPGEPHRCCRQVEAAALRAQVLRPGQRAAGDHGPGAVGAGSPGRCGSTSKSARTSSPCRAASRRCWPRPAATASLVLAHQHLAQLGRDLREAISWARPQQGLLLDVARGRPHPCSARGPGVERARPVPPRPLRRCRPPDDRRGGDSGLHAADPANPPPAPERASALRPAARRTYDRSRQSEPPARLGGAWRDVSCREVTRRPPRGTSLPASDRSSP